MHRASVAVFNTQAKESTVVFTSMELDDPNVDFFVRRQSSSIDISKEASQVGYVVYTVRVVALQDNFADLGCVATGIVGSVHTQDGTPTFHRLQENGV